MKTAHVNGDFLPLDEARVSVLDRGFLFADAAYEVIPVYTGQPFLLEAHLARLENSLRALLIPNPHDRQRWTALLRELISRNGGGDMSLYLQVTRGCQPKRDHAMPENPTPGIVAFCQPLPTIDKAVLEKGVGVVTRPDTRWADCYVKSTALLPNLLARHEATRNQAAETLLIRDGQVLEGAASNVFMVFGDELITPPEDRHILPGITRCLVLALARKNRIPVRETATTEDSLPNAEEIWLTSSTREIIPVTRLNGAPVGNGRPGPVWQRCHDLVQAYKESPDDNLFSAS